MIRWDLAPPGTVIACDTLIGERPAIRSWARRDADPAPATRLFTLWQEVDFAALNRPGGTMRVMTMIEARADLSPRRITILSAAGRAEIRFLRTRTAVRLADRTRIDQPPEPIALVLPDNAPALLAFYLQLLGDAGRLPDTFAAYLPATLATIPYAIEREPRGWRTSLGEHIAVDGEGWLETLTLGPSSAIRIVRVDRPVPRWRELAGARPGTKSAKPKRWGPARDIVASFDGRPCHGRLSTLAAPRAALLFIGGSGTHDRFGRAGSIDLGYGEIAARLTAGNIACLLFDKPGSGRTRIDPAGVRPDFHRTIAYADQWLDRLLALRPPGVPVVLAGHSQGGQIAAALAARRHDVDALCLLATAASPIDAILAEQIGMEAQDMDLDDSALRSRIADLEIFFAWVRQGDRSAPLLDRLAPMAPFADWYAGLIDTAPALTLPHVDVPIAILQGERDIQVRSGEAADLAALTSGGRTTVKLFPTLDHLFKPGPQATNIRAYGDRRRHVAPAVTEWLLAWIDATLAPVG